MAALLTLDVAWLGAGDQELDGLVVRRGRDAVLGFDDGISLDVRVLDPARSRSAAALVEASRGESGPGRVVLVAGAVPVQWRAALRDAEVSFIDVSGVVEIWWPRLRVSARRLGLPVTRRRHGLPLQKGFARVVQELLIVAGDGDRPTIGELAEGAGVSLSTASRVVSQLAEHGLVAKNRHDGHVRVAVVDRVEVAERLAARSAWPGDETVIGYLWGRTVFDTASRLSATAADHGLGLAVTGRVGAAYHGVLGTSSPRTVRAWVDCRGGDLAVAAAGLGLEPAPEETANVVLSADPWRVGVHHRSEASYDEWTATVAHPLRVWCDLRGEARGA